MWPWWPWPDRLGRGTGGGWWGLVVAVGVWRAAARFPAMMALVSESRGRELDESTVVVE